VQAVEGMGVEKSIEKTGTPDVADDHKILPFKPHIQKSPVKCPGYTVVGTPGTENRGSVGIE
jgi:hypothetical protein